MKKMLIATTLLLSSISQADLVKCTFTEPFIDTTYSMTQSTLTYKDIEGKSSVIKNVSFQIKGAGKFNLVSKVLTLRWSTVPSRDLYDSFIYRR